MKRVTIIGGGVGGLATAYLLERKSPHEYQATVFEASDRVGGKVLTKQFKSTPIHYEAGAGELYGYWKVGPDPLRKLIKALDLEMIKLSGQTVVMGNRIMRTPSEIKCHFGKKTLNSITNFERHGRSILSPKRYYDAGWRRRNGHRLTRRSFRALLSSVPDVTAQKYLSIIVHSDLAIEPHMTNALFGLENFLMHDPRYVRFYSLRGGLERLPQALLASVSAEVKLNRRVVAIDKTEADRYRVCWNGNDELESDDFDAIVLALPNYCLQHIKWGIKPLANTMEAHHAYYDAPGQYIRVTVLFRERYWRPLMSGSYLQIDAFGGCCVYDESEAQETNGFGVLSWLIGGSAAVAMNFFDDDALIEKVLESLPPALAPPNGLMVEVSVERWLGTVNAPPPGFRMLGARRRHAPWRKDHAGLFVVGDYLFDSTINGVVDSADIATDLLVEGFARQRRAPVDTAPAKDGGLDRTYFDSYDGNRSYAKSFKEAFNAKYIVKLVRAVWDVAPPYRLLDAGSASGLTLAALSKEGVDAWGVENNPYIHAKTKRKFLHRNIAGDVCDLPFEDDYFEFVYETCLCYVPDAHIDRALAELLRVTRRGIFFGSVSKGMRKKILRKYDLRYGVNTLDSGKNWARRFVHAGWELAITNEQTQAKIWQIEKKICAGQPWYRSRRSMRLCFFSKPARSGMVAMDEGSMLESVGDPHQLGLKRHSKPMQPMA